MRTGVRLLPVILSELILAAHFLRAAQFAGVACCLAALGLLLVQRPWAARLTQGLLALGAIEWLWTLARLVVERRDLGEPWLRMAGILAGVAIATAASALVFRTARLRRCYGLGASPRQG
jgi:hypothetical protein